MTQFGSKEWVAKAKKRKAYRDHYRDKFFSQFSVEKGAVPWSAEGSPIQQRRKILKLMKLTKSGNALTPDQEKMMVTLAKTMLQVGLGKGVMGITAPSLLDLDLVSYSNLKKFFR